MECGQKKFEDSVWITRKNRINASERLLETERFIQNLNIYYSCFTAIISVYSLISDNRNIAIASVLFTVVLAISIVYLNAQKFGERAQQLKTNYIALQQLLFEVQHVNKDDPSQIEEQMELLQKKYCDLLANCENHSEWDYCKTRYGCDLLKGSEYSKYVIHVWWLE